METRSYKIQSQGAGFIRFEGLKLLISKHIFTARGESEIITVEQDKRFNKLYLKFTPDAVEHVKEIKQPLQKPIQALNEVLGLDNAITESVIKLDNDAKSLLKENILATVEANSRTGQGEEKAQTQKARKSKTSKSSISVLNLAKGIEKILIASGITTVSQLSAKTEEELIAIKGIAHKGVNAIKAKLSEAGKQLAAK